jgi:hypothetical protein
VAYCGELEDVRWQDVIEWCRRDRDDIAQTMMRLYPEFEDSPPSAWIEDVICTVCGFRIHDQPLPSGQLGLCDVANKLVLINSEMKIFMDPHVDLTAVRNSTLGHELGHIRMHSDELQGLYVSQHGRWETYRDSRVYQRELEADLYAAVFLVPSNMLVRHSKGREIYSAWREQRQIKADRLGKLINALAKDFNISSVLMRRSLEERGWLVPWRTIKTYQIAVNG